MKPTPEQHAYFCRLYEAMFANGKPGDKMATNGQIAERFHAIIAEIQQDAREGMVPMEDVLTLIEGLRQISVAGNAGMPLLPKVTGGAMRTTKGFSQDLLTDFRAKHPNLFTK